MELRHNFLLHCLYGLISCPSDHEQSLQVEVNLQLFIHLLYFPPSSLDSKFLFMVTGEYNESGLILPFNKLVYSFFLFKHSVSSLSLNCCLLFIHSVCFKTPLAGDISLAPFRLILVMIPATRREKRWISAFYHDTGTSCLIGVINLAQF